MLTNNLQQVSEELREFYLAQERIIMDKFVFALSSLSDKELMAQDCKAYQKIENAKHPFSGIDKTDRDVASFTRDACYKILRKRGYEKGSFANDWRKKAES